ncbi:MAG TPA: hypothetical protein VK796_09520 [Cytophaga sp.]|jgi:hypothetical protein|nr:hypothetical protein [Cytophaga sp.]
MITKKIVLETQITEQALSEEIHSLNKINGFKITTKTSSFYLRKNFYRKGGNSANLFKYKVSSKPLHDRLQEIEVKIYPKTLVLLLCIVIALGCLIFMLTGKFFTGIFNLLLLSYSYYTFINSACEEIDKMLVKKIK